MKRKIITISDQGLVSVPSNTKMSISEIANLFGIYYQTTKRHIRSIEKSGVAGGDYSMCCTSDGNSVYPEYYGLEMIIAIAFRIQSAQAEIFRSWICRKTIHSETQIMFTTLNNKAIMN